MKKIILAAALAAAAVFFTFRIVIPTVKVGGLFVDFSRDFFQPGSIVAPEWLHLFPHDVEVRQVAIPTDSESLQADLYLPADARHKKVPATVFMYGVTDAYSDARIPKLARIIARSGIAVLVPYFSELSQQYFTQRTITQIQDSFLYLQGQPFVEKKKEGFFAFCVGASLAITASEDDRIASDVGYIYALTAYYDFATIGPAVFSSQYKQNEKWVPWQQLGTVSRDIYREELLRVLPEGDAHVLRSAIAGSTALDGAVFEKLSPDGKVVWRIFTTKDPAELEALFTQLSQPVRLTLKRLSPSWQREKLKAPVFLEYGFDGYIPPSEEQSLIRELGGRVDAVHFSVFNHVTPQFDNISGFQKIRETAKLINHLRKLYLVAT